MLQGSENCCNDIQCAGLFPRKETGHLLFSHSDMKRHFYFCRPPLSDRFSRRVPPRYFFPLQNSRGDINTHIRERGLRRRERKGEFWDDLQYGYRSRTFKEFPLLPIFRIPSIIVLRPTQRVPRAGFSNLLASVLLYDPSASRDTYMPVNRVYPRSSASREQHVSRSIFNSRIVHYFLQ